MELKYFGFRSLKGRDSSFVADCSPACLDLLVYLVAHEREFTYSSIVVNTDIRPKSPPNDGLLPYMGIDKEYVSETKHIIQKIGNPLDVSLDKSQQNTTYLIRNLIETSCCWTVGFDWRWGDEKTCKKITAPFYLDGLEVSEFLQSKAMMDARDDQIKRLEMSGVGLQMDMVTERIKRGNLDLLSIENKIANRGGFFFDGETPTSIDCALYGMTANALFTAKNYPVKSRDDPVKQLLDGKYPKILEHYEFMEKMYGRTLEEKVYDPYQIHSTVQIIPTKEKQKGPSHVPGFFTDKHGNLKLVNIIVRFPITVFCLILAVVIVLSFLLFQLVLKGGNPFADPSAPSYDIKDERSTALDSFRLISEEVMKTRELAAISNRRLEDGSGPAVPFQSAYEDVTYWAYESETPDGVFGTRESIEAMRETLVLFTENEDYEKFCYKRFEGQCIPPSSVINMYYASEWDSETVQSIIDQLKDPANVLRYNSLGVCVEFAIFCDQIPARYNNFDDATWAIEFNRNMTRVISKWDGTGELVEDHQQATELAAHLKQLFTKRGLIDFGFDEKFSVDNQVSQYSRMFILWGSPLDRSILEDVGVDFTKENGDVKTDRIFFKEWIAKTFLDDMDEFADEDYSLLLNSYYFMETIIGDVLLKVVIRDSLLALFSFTFVFLYIRVMVGSWFLAVVGLTQIFFSIPLSWFFYSQVLRIEYFSLLNALTLFIVAAIGADDVFIFMDAYKQSILQGPQVLSSFESRMSWVYRRTGSAMAITSATTCSAFLCTLLTPLVAVQAFGIFAALVIFIDYVLVMSLYCTAVVIYHNKFEKGACCCAPSCCYGGFCATSDPTSTEKAFQQAKAMHWETPEGDKISSFFRTKVTVFLMSPLNRILLLLMFVGWVATAAYFGVGIEPIKETEEFLNENHPLQKSFTILGERFPNTENDQGSAIYFAWGVGDVDRDGVNQLLDTEYLGTPTFIDTFDLNEQCQALMVEACADFQTNHKSHIKQEDGIGSVKCFIEEFAAYSVYGSLDDCDAVIRGAWKNENWQVPSEEVANLMEGFLKEKTCYSQTQEDVLTFYEKEIGWDGVSLKYASISVESDVVDPFTTNPEQVLRVEYDAFSEIRDNLDRATMEACGSRVLMTDLDNHFVFMNTQRLYVRSAFQSAGVGLAIAFLVLLLATRVFHIALFATINILCVLFSVLGSTVLLGWDLGSIESILIAITAGFSVDYVVHLAHAYERAEGDTYTRMSTAFGEMGISVFSGMVTSVGASVPLFFCQLQFFKKFGTFICLTIAFSWIFANFFFMTLLGQMRIPIDNSKKCLRP